MMDLRDLLEDFAARPAPSAPPPPSEPDPMVLEQVRKEAFAEGYLAGEQAARDALDAARAEGMERLTQVLADLDFTVVQAERVLAERVAVLLQTMVRTVLPRARQMALPEVLREAISSLASSALEGPVALHIASDLGDALDELALEGGERVLLAVDDRLPAGAVHISLQDQNVILDLAGITSALEEALGAFDDAHTATVGEQISQKGIQNG